MLTFTAVDVILSSASFITTASSTFFVFYKEGFGHLAQEPQHSHWKVFLVFHQFDVDTVGNACKNVRGSRAQVIMQQIRTVRMSVQNRYVD